MLGHPEPYVGDRECAQDRHRDDRAVSRDQDLVSTREDRLPGIAGRRGHRRAITFAEAQRERGKDVRHEVEKEDLQGRDRERRIHQRRQADISTSLRLHDRR